ncbi:MAG: hypothetical protein FWE25_10680 [Lachnospiraceae bacterium]|nr:hypothetical protein [Lachnospiraceae bacterium]
MGTIRKKSVKKKNHRCFWKQILGLMLIILMMIGGIQALASNVFDSSNQEIEVGASIDLEEAEVEVQVDSEEEQQEQEEIEIERQEIPDLNNIEATEIPIMPFVAETVTTAAAFRLAVQNPEVTVINLGGSFSVTYTGTAGSSVPVLTRSLIINGNGHTITATNSNGIVILGAVPAPAATATLTLNNIRFDQTAAGVGYVFAGTATNTANWRIYLENNVRTGSGIMATGTARSTLLTHGWEHLMTWRGGSNTNANEPNRNGLVDAQNGHVIVTGTGNHLGMRGTNGDANRHHLWIRHLEMRSGSSLHITSANDVASAIRIANAGTIDIDNATLEIWNVGTRTPAPAETAAAATWLTATGPAQSNGISGNIGSTNIRNNARVNIETSHHGYISQSSHTFELSGASVMNIITNASHGVCFALAPTLRSDAGLTLTHSVAVRGVDTQLNMFSNNNHQQNGGSALTMVGNDSHIIVEDGAIMNAYSARTSAVVIHGERSVFDVERGGVIRAMARGAGNVQAGAFRFRQAGRMTFNINGGDVIIIAGPTNPSQALRFYGGTNTTHVSNGGRLSVRHYNTATSTITQAGTTFGNNHASDPLRAAVLFTSNHITGGADRFYLTDRYSQVDVFAAGGIGLAGGSGTAVTRIQAVEGTIFTIDGHRPSGEAVIRGGRLNFDMVTPLFFDFRNRGGGRVFTAEHTVGNPARWTGLGTDMAVWATTPATFAGDPVEAWSRINFHVSGVNLAADIPAGNVIAAGGVFGTPDSTDSAAFRLRYNPMSPNIGRISANNAGPRVDWLRIPTNADMRVFGHVSVQEGRQMFTRSAWAGEVWVDVAFRNPAGNVVFEAEGVTDNRSMFGEPARDGIFEVVFAPNGTPELLPEGYTIEVVNARRWSGGRTAENINHYHPARIPQDILSSVERTRDVMPPRPVELAAALATIPSNATSIAGTTDPYSVIRISINNAWIMEGSVPRTVQADSTGAFTFPLTGVTLVHDQQVRIHASDERAMNIQRPQAPFAINHNLYDIVNSPITVAPNNGIPRTAGTPTLNGYVVNGNIHWIDATPFHDATIPAATMRLVEHVGNITISVPDTIDFGTMTVGPGARFGNRLPHDPIVVTDARLVRDNWRVGATLVDDPLTNTVMNHTLPNGLVRRHGDGSGGFMSSVITPHTAVVFHSHTPTGSGVVPEITDVSAPWNSTNNGLMIETFGEMVRIGNYNAVIEWSIMPGVPD